MSNYTLRYDCLDIQLFAEGGGGEGGGTGAEGAGGAPTLPTTGANTNPLAAVVYGKQEEVAPAAGEPSTEEGTAPEDRSAQFEALIKGDYREEYARRMEAAVKGRLRANEATVAKYNAMAPMLELLAGKYGVDAGDVSALTHAIEEDESYYEQEASDTGMTVQQIKEMRKMQRETAELRAQLQERQSREQADALYSSWMQQAEELKQVYPQFDLNGELANESFTQLLRANIPVRTAYEVVHKDDILAAGMQFAAKQAAGKVANAVRAGQNRPKEGAMGNQSAVITKSDVSQLTRADRDEIERRVARGERISF